MLHLLKPRGLARRYRRDLLLFRIRLRLRLTVCRRPRRHLGPMLIQSQGGPFSSTLQTVAHLLSLARNADARVRRRSDRVRLHRRRRTMRPEGSRRCRGHYSDAGAIRCYSLETPRDRARLDHVSRSAPMSNCRDTCFHVRHVFPHVRHCILQRSFVMRRKSVHLHVTTHLRHLLAHSGDRFLCLTNCTLCGRRQRFLSTCRSHHLMGSIGGAHCTWLNWIGHRRVHRSGWCCHPSCRLWYCNGWR